MPEVTTPSATALPNATDQTALAPSPLAAFLAAENPALQLTPRAGVLTPQSFDAPQAETTALLAGAAVHDLGWLRRLSVRGEDRSRWLSGMVTNTVSGLAPRGGAWNLVLNAQGRILGDLEVWRDGDALELVLAANQYDRLLAHLDRFIVMDDVELVPLTLDAEGALTGLSAL
ncbi:MAG: hypothetical protein WCE75_01885, partial [Terracidiphilus sp.]